jgi:murein DD-endopeptidase MepM/ murein hydrolase activator NlpD
LTLAAVGTCTAGVAMVVAPQAAVPAMAEDSVRQALAVAARPQRPEMGAVQRALLAASLPQAAAPDERSAPAADATAEREGEDLNAVIPTAPPERWLTSRNRRCQRKSGHRFCDGPLKVARPDGAAAELAERLGLGQLKTASHLLQNPPEPAWVEAVEGEPRPSLRWPVDGGALWRGFGRVPRRTGGKRLHKGVDIGADPGTPVLAVNDALVAYSNYEVRGYGNTVMLVHADGSTSLYAHLRAAYVFPGQQVKRGQVIAESGHTGISRGPHLHYEWRVGGRPRDPAHRFVAVPQDQIIRLPRNALARLNADQL